MKNLILIVTIMASSMVASAQSVFDKFEDLEDVTSVVVNQKMFKMFSKSGQNLFKTGPKPAQNHMLLH